MARTLRMGDYGVGRMKLREICDFVHFLSSWQLARGGCVTLPDFWRILEVLGIDVFTNAPFRIFDPTNFETMEFDLQRWLGDREFRRAFGRIR